jgi:uncharacterized protein (TIGR02217 family)
MASFTWADDDMFIDTRFPLALSTNATFSLRYSVLVARMDDGGEARQGRWSSPLRSYTVRSARTMAEMETLRRFWSAAGGPFRSFRFKDFSDYTSSTFAEGATLPSAITPLDQNIGTGDGVTTAFSLRKQYIVTDDDGTTWTVNRPITKPVAGTTRIAVNGSELTNSGSPQDWDIDTDTGTVTFTSPPANGHAITAGYEFDVHARFEGDTLASTLVSTFELESSGIQIVELRRA